MIERLLDDLTNSLEQINGAGYSWSFDYLDYSLTIHDPHDGFRPLYRVYNSSSGVTWDTHD